MREREEPITTNALAERIAGLDRLTEAKFITYQTLMDLQAEKVALALSASDKAITKAESANEKRFDLLNEFRQQSADWRTTFATREMVELALSQTVKIVEENRAEMRERLHEVQATANRLMYGLMATIITSLIGALFLANR